MSKYLGPRKTIYFRPPPALRAQLVKAAKLQRKTINELIIERIETALKQQETKP